MLKCFIKHPSRKWKTLVHFISDTVYGSPRSRAESSKSAEDNFWRQVYLMGAYRLPSLFFFVSVCMHAFCACGTWKPELILPVFCSSFLSCVFEIESLFETSASCFFEATQPASTQ